MNISSLKLIDKHYINGQFVAPVLNQTFEVINPSNQTILGIAPKGSIQDIDLAVKAARNAFDQGQWSKMSPSQRSKLMLKLADLLQKNAEELALMQSVNVGKPLMFAKMVDVNMTIQVFRYYAGWVDKIRGHTLGSEGPFFSYTTKQPVGVVGQIIPWNFPLCMLSWKIAPCLAAGCTIVLKPAQSTPFSALRFAQLVQEAGFPPGVVNIVTGFGDIGAYLVRHPDVDKVAFTGSCAVGCDIMKNCHPKNLKRVTLQLGGKSPNIITKNANLVKAMKQSTEAIFFNSGQICNAGSRTFVHSSIYDKYLEMIVSATKMWKVGNPLEEGVMLGPIINKTQFQKVLNYIQKGKQEGAKLLFGGKRVGEKGYFIQPTIFADVTDDMTIAKEEIFGPVMCILKYDDLDQVIKRSNATDYGLAGGIVSQDFSQIQYIIKRLKAGHVYVNCYGAIQVTTPFGGYKNSGIGRELGEQGLNTYLQTKSVIHQY